MKFFVFAWRIVRNLASFIIVILGLVLIIDLILSTTRTPYLIKVIEKIISQ